LGRDPPLPIQDAVVETSTTVAPVPLLELSPLQLRRLLDDEEACMAYLTQRRWTDGVARCPTCGERADVHPTKRFHFVCRFGCPPRHGFSARKGTPFEATRVPLGSWLYAVRLLLLQPTIRTVQIANAARLNPYTATHMRQRIVASLSSPEFRRLLGLPPSV
jgi:hypothetical protein